MQWLKSNFAFHCAGAIYHCIHFATTSFLQVPSVFTPTQGVMATLATLTMVHIVCLAIWHYLFLKLWLFHTWFFTHLIFWHQQHAVTCLENVHQLNIRRGKKLVFPRCFHYYSAVAYFLRLGPQLFLYNIRFSFLFNLGYYRDKKSKTIFNKKLSTCSISEIKMHCF